MTREKCDCVKLVIKVTQSESELKVGEEERDALVLNGVIGQSEPAQLATKNDSFTLNHLKSTL